MKYEEFKSELLMEMQGFQSVFDVTYDFKQKFMKLVELCTFSLMNDEENFFALFMIQMKRDIKFDMPSATGISACISNFTIYFNPAIFLYCTLEEMKALIKHEVYHIMNSHLKRAAVLQDKYSALAVNTAMDISINQYIKGLPAFMVSLEGVRRSYNADLRADGTIEEYAAALQEAINRLKTDKSNKHLSKAIEIEYDAGRTHDIWELSQDSYYLEQLDELVKKAAANASKGRIPPGLMESINALYEKPEISWKQYLKKIAGTVPSGYKKTITRKDRRQPDRLELRGKLPDHNIRIATAIDISGSMTDSEVDQAMAEIFSILGSTSREITVIECDNEIRRVYKARDKRDIKKKLNTRGGTMFSPVFKYLREHGMRSYLLIYFTDGVGENELEIRPSNYKTLWVLTGKGEALSLNRSYGEVKHLSGKKIEAHEADYGGKNELKDMLIEWAK